MVEQVYWQISKPSNSIVAWFRYCLGNYRPDGGPIFSYQLVVFRSYQEAVPAFAGAISCSGSQDRDHGKYEHPAAAYRLAQIDEQPYPDYLGPGHRSFFRISIYVR